MIKIVLISTKERTSVGVMNTHYIDKSYEMVIFSVLVVFLLFITVLFILLARKVLHKREKEKSSANKSRNNKNTITDFKTDNIENAWHTEKQIADEQFNKAQITGRDKYISVYRNELELISLLRWNETQSDASSVGEITGEADCNESDIADIKRRISEINSKVIDYSDIKGKFSLLDISDICCNITDGGNFSVTADVTVGKAYRDLCEHTVLDGSLKVIVTDSNGVQVGHGYLCANGFNEIDSGKVGFACYDGNSRIHKLSALCIADNKNFDKNQKYYVSVEPYRLWTLER
ncbi:MAG: hypothetical protein ACI4JV_08235 [Ruminiclostridium sp.]